MDDDLGKLISNFVRGIFKFTDKILELTSNIDVQAIKAKGRYNSRVSVSTSNGYSVINNGSRTVRMNPDGVVISEGSLVTSVGSDGTVLRNGKVLIQDGGDIVRIGHNGVFVQDGSGSVTLSQSNSWEHKLEPYVPIMIGGIVVVYGVKTRQLQVTCVAGGLTVAYTVGLIFSRFW